LPHLAVLVCCQSACLNAATVIVT